MEQQARYNWMSAKRKHGMTLLNSPSSYGDSWEEQAFAEDAAGALGGCIWPPRSYTCSFCRREFRSAQALGGHMNVHRRDRARMKQSSPSNNNPSVHDNHQVFVPPPPPPPPHRHHHHNNSLSCTDSSLLMPHPCRILQKHTSFGESETHPLTYLKSSSNTDNSHIQYPSKICTFVYNPNSDSDLGGPIRVHSSFSSIVQEENKNKLSSPPSSIWSNLVAADKYSCLSNDEEKKLKSIDFKKDIQERNLEVLMIDSSSFRAKQDHVLETNYCKRRRVVDQEDNISFANLFTKTSSSIERCRPQSEALERIPSAIEELDLELRL